MTELLAQRLKRETKALHTEVERTGIMPDILRGKVVRSSYCKLLRNLYEIYAALEPALARNAADPWLASIDLAPLARCASLEDDLSALHGPEWKSDISVCAAADEYRVRLATLGATQPQLLLAHAYVRYLGDLSGGQILRRIVAESLQLDSADGVHFYTFGEPGTAILATRFRDALNAVAVDEAGANLLVNEAKAGFALHAELFSQMT